MRKLAIATGIIFAACAGFAPAVAQGQPDRARPGRPTITVTGRGMVAAQPDYATVRMGAVIQRDQANLAMDDVNGIMNRAIVEIVRLGIPRSRIQTTGLMLNPVYTQPPRPVDRGVGVPAQPTIAGYRASNTIRIRVDDLDRVGYVIDEAVTAGANQFEGISFGLENETPQRQQALSEAATEARAKARSIASALGVELGPVLDVSEGGGQIVRPQERYMAMSAAREQAGGTPIQPGEMEIEAQVQVTYLIAREEASDRGGDGARPVSPSPATQPQRSGQ